MLSRQSIILTRSLAIAVVLSLALSGPAARADSARALVSVVPTFTDLVVGDETTIYVRVSDVTDFYGVDVTLSFDPTLLEVVDSDSATAGVQVQAWPKLSASQRSNTVTIAHEASNATGTVKLVTSFLSPAQPVTGSIEILAMTLRALAPGRASIAIVSSDLATKDGDAIAHSTANGTLAITGPLDHFGFTLPPDSVTAGVPFAATVTALDSDGAVVAAYSGSVALSGTAGVLQGYGTVSLVGGSWTGTLVVTAAGAARTLAAAAGSVSSASTPFAVLPGGPAAVSLVAAAEVLEVGESTSLVATVTDAYGNAVADGTMVSFGCDLGSITAATTTTNGAATATFTADTTGTAVVTATAGSASDSIEIAVSAAPAEVLRVMMPFVMMGG